jgi:hypothetical protein
MKLFIFMKKYFDEAFRNAGGKEEWKQLANLLTNE